MVITSLYENVLDGVYISGVARVFATRGGPYTCHPLKKKMSQTGYSRPRAKILKAHQLIIYFP